MFFCTFMPQFFFRLANTFSRRRSIFSSFASMSGSYIGISRANPTRDPALLENTVTSLLRLNVSRLITIGGDDTAFSAMQLECVREDGEWRAIVLSKTS